MSDSPTPPIDPRPMFDWTRFRSTLKGLATAAAISTPLFVAAKILILAKGDADAAAVILAQTDVARFALAALVYLVPLVLSLAVVAIPTYFRDQRLAFLAAALVITVGFASALARRPGLGNSVWVSAAMLAFFAVAYTSLIWRARNRFGFEELSFRGLGTPRESFKRLRQTIHGADVARLAFLSLLVAAGITTIIAELVSPSSVLTLGLLSQPTKWVAFETADTLLPVTWTAEGDGGTYYLLRDEPASCCVS